MSDFTVYPAIDLRKGQVIRLKEGDISRQTSYGITPGEAARRWLNEGARWLHVVNLDGAFGHCQDANHQALAAILSVAGERGGRVQVGGGIRTLDDADAMLCAGAARVILGTALIEDPTLASQAVRRFGAVRVVAGLDARDGQLKTRGWLDDSGLNAKTAAIRAATDGIETIIFTNIARDGVGTGVDVAATHRLAQDCGLTVIASGGVANLADIRAVRAADLPGVIVGRALYEGQVDLSEALRC